jgi:uncharacterized membrane protein YdbT with pleckstrin-like domain
VPTLFQASTPKPTVHTKKIPVSSSIGPLTCFAVNPQGVRFETQEEEETVILFLRQHIIVNIPWIFLAFILVITPTILLPLFFNLIGFSPAVPTGYVVFSTLFWYLGAFGFVLAKFLGWFFNIYIVTNERVVDIDFFYLLYKNFSQAELNKVQDISFSSGGIFATLFNYGDVIVETAGESPNLEFTKVPYPERVVETMRSLIEKTEDNP